MSASGDAPAVSTVRAPPMQNPVTPTFGLVLLQELHRAADVLRGRIAEVEPGHQVLGLS
jgi:hypothetical protein